MPIAAKLSLLITSVLLQLLTVFTLVTLWPAWDYSGYAYNVLAINIWCITQVPSTFCDK